jgi:hypothetical protein
LSSESFSSCDMSIVFDCKVAAMSRFSLFSAIRSVEGL